MLTREEWFFEVAGREITEGQLSQAIWGKAFSLTAGDDQKAKALYVKLRVDQLEREHRQAITSLIREARSEIVQGRPFCCPHCENRTTAKTTDVDFFVQLFTGCSRFRYNCCSCQTELVVGESNNRPVSLEEVPAGKKNNGLAVTGFAFGLASVIMYPLGLVPILAALLSAFGLSTFDSAIHKNKWMGFVGLALGVIYFIVMMGHHGALK